VKTPGCAASTHSLPTDGFPNLARFFAPRSVALLGATEDLSKFGGRCMRQIINFGFAGDLYPINPKRDEVFGHRCFPSVAALPQTPDHIGIVLPAQAVAAALEQCAERGVPYATVFSSGFSETGTEEGRCLQQRIVEIARAAGIRLMGPRSTTTFTIRFNHEVQGIQSCDRHRWRQGLGPGDGAWSSST